MDDSSLEFLIDPAIQRKLEDREMIDRELAHGLSGQQILNFSDETMAKFYGTAYNLFEQERYTDASNVFLFLATLNPKNHDYWLGLGMAIQMTGAYEAAIDAYEMAAICHLDSPVPYFYLAKCLFAIHDHPGAKQALELSIEYSTDHPQYRELHTQATVALRLVDRSNESDSEA